MNFYHLDDIPDDLKRYFMPAPQIGLEKTPEEYIIKMVTVFREIKRVMRNDASLWLNLGDSYAHGKCGRFDAIHNPLIGGKPISSKFKDEPKIRITPVGFKSKDLIGIPWRIAFALQSDGWYLRSDIIWAKPNPMPESVKDRPTRAHEYIFLFSKSTKYYYDANSIREPFKQSSLSRINQENFFGQTGGGKDYGKNSNRSARKSLENLAKNIRYGWATSPHYKGQDPRYPIREKQRGHPRCQGNTTGMFDKPKQEQQINGANKRTVWWIATQPCKENHFATFPWKLVEPCIKAGCPPNGIVLDPFVGSGTVAMVAKKLGRQYIGIDLNPTYIAMAERRLTAINPLFDKNMEENNYAVR